jgi:exodeoxyribonuclease VIII
MKYELEINNGISDQDYHQGPGISSSGIKLVRCSPLHLWDQYINPQKEPIDSDSLCLGRATHCLILEPDSFDERYAIEPNNNKRTNAGKAEYAQWVSENTGKSIISAEQSIFWVDPSTNTLCKVRPDYLRADIIVDVKTTKDASKLAFERDIANYKYHLSAAMYVEGYARAGLGGQHFVLIALESTRPFACAVYDIQDLALDRGRELFREGLEIYSQCKDADSWSGYSEDIEPISISG